MTEWILCPECGGKGGEEFYVDVDRTMAFDCRTCHGECEIEVEVELYEDEPTEKWFKLRDLGEDVSK